MKEDSHSQQLSNVETHANTRISDAEELIDEAAGSNEDDANEPSTKSSCGNGGIVVVVDDSSHFGIWRVLHQRIKKDPVRIRHETLTTTTRAASTLSSS